ncbi:MAG TPA: hypothetical protein VMU84_05800, partial [Thermoanaerobaculia bacterium]|nr:hypothetical protein [Thermoanaerobaculia bacterium]
LEVAIALATRPRFRAALPSTIAVAFVIIFFAWSGIVARALPYFLRPARPTLPRLTIAQALAPSQSVVLDVPDGVHSLIVSGANVPRLKRGTLLGTLDARPIRIGDVSDWGYTRREFFYGTHNPLPRDAAGKIRGYGYDAWIDGAGRIPLPRGARRIRVTAAATLPRDASLQVEAFE